MTLLDRFRAQPPQKHADPAVRLSYVQEIPIDERADRVDIEVSRAVCRVLISHRPVPWLES